jgi:hypothetical protein
LGLLPALFAVTAIKMTIVGVIVGFEVIACTPDHVVRLRKVTNFFLVTLLFVGWVPAFSNSFLMVKGSI